MVVNTIKPEKVTGLTVKGTATEKSATLAWNPGKDDVGVVSYEILVSGISKVFKSKTNSINIKKLSAGTHTFTVYAIDKDKNKSIVSDSMSFNVLDGTAPKAGKLTAVQKGQDSVLLSFGNFSDNMGIARYDILLNGKVVGSTTDKSFTYTGTNLAGNLQFAVRAYDAAGNVSKDAKAKVKIADKANPDKVTGLTVKGTATEKSTTLAWNAGKDNVGVVSYEIVVSGSSKVYKSKTNSINIKKLAAGAHTFTVYAVDKAKNKSIVSDKMSFTVLDGVAPKAGKVTAVQKGKDTVQLSFANFSDNLGIARYDILLNGKVVGSTTQKSYTYTGTNLSGTLQFAVRAYDAAGNVSKDAKAKVKIVASAAPTPENKPSVTPTPDKPSVTPTPDKPSVTPTPDKPSVTPTPDKPAGLSLTIGGIDYETYEKLDWGECNCKAPWDKWNEHYNNCVPKEAKAGKIVGTAANDEVNFAPNVSRFFDSIDLGEGDDSIVLKDSQIAGDEFEVNGNEGANILLGNGNDSLYIGTCHEIECSKVDFGAGNNTMTLARLGSVECKEISFGDGNDKLTGGDDAYIETASINFGAGDDCFEIKAGMLVDDLEKLDFGAGNDTLIINGVLEADDLKNIAGLENISGNGVVTYASESDPLNDNTKAFIEKCRNSGITVIDTLGGGWDGCTPSEALADNNMAGARVLGEVYNDIDIWLCGKTAAGMSADGFADEVDYVKFVNTNPENGIYLQADPQVMTVEMQVANGAWEKVALSASGEWMKNGLAVGTYNFKFTVADGAVGTGCIEIM